MIKKYIKNIVYKYIDAVIPADKVNYYCPCCNVKLSKMKKFFTPEAAKISDENRYKDETQAVICPNCLSLPRHRILVEYFRHNRRIVDGDKNILYFAMEGAVGRWLKRRGIKCVTADLFDPEADLKIDIMDTGLPEKSYDLIVCNHVLEHVEDFHVAIDELRRLLKDDGVLIISFPIDETFETVYENCEIINDEQRKIHFGQIDHLRIFGKDSEKILEKHGFSVKRISGEHYPDYIMPVTGPADYDVNYLFECRRN